jgi:DNA-binding CsgD family transcriptional regulator
VTDDNTSFRPVKPARKRAGVPSLAVVAGPAAGTHVVLDVDALTIGRGAECGLSIADRGLSRIHVKVVRASDGIVNLIDLGSTNGTLVNGERVTAVILRSGDEIQLGPDTVLHYSCGPQSAAGDGDAALRSRIEHALTKRELEVAILVARGLSNQRIAKELALSVRTIESHLDHAYNKLDVDSRTELSAMLHRSGLVGSP